MSKKSDLKNEGIGITSITIIIILALGGLYYFFSSKAHKVATKSAVHTKVPVEVPSPIVEDNTGSK